MRYYLSVLKNYAKFSGRARRKEYWMFALFHFIFLIIAAIIDNIFGDTFTNPSTGASMVYGYIYLLYSLFVFIPGLAVSIRRLHDIGKNGWKELALSFVILFLTIIIAGFIGKNGGITFVPILLMIGWLGVAIWILTLMCKDSAPGPNKYGPNPKGVGNEVL